MVQIQSKPITLQAFLELPETQPASEYIDGRIIQKPMPKGKHSTLQSELTPLINAVVKPQKVARAFAELRCTFGGHSIVPDISVFTWAQIPTDSSGEIADIFPSAPDWMIEILSPGQRQSKVTKKIVRCLEYGTQMAWLIDPSDKAVSIFQPQKIIVLDMAEEADISIPVPGFVLQPGKGQPENELTLTVADLFGLLVL